MDSPLSDFSSNDTPEKDEDVDNSSSIDLDQIMKMKQERLKILQDINKEDEDDSVLPVNEVQNNVKKKEFINRGRKRTDLTTVTPMRRSQRISCKSEEKQIKVIEVQQVIAERPENDYGPMPGIKVGHHWETRLECSYDGIHRPTVAGIHGGPKGAYSIALSGGYPEDVDEGHTFTYTGAGGRELKGTAMKPKNLRIAPQTKDQQLEGVNYSLVKSIETKKPVRVIRGYKLNSVFAPESGYRYDGLYQVVKYWKDFGKTGFRVYRFKMVRMEGQEPAPWEQPRKKTGKITKYLKIVGNENSDPNENCSTEETFQDSNLFEDGFIINSIDRKGESELDNDIRKCYEQLCKTFAVKSDVIDYLREHSEDSFLGWD